MPFYGRPSLLSRPLSQHRLGLFTEVCKCGYNSVALLGTCTHMYSVHIHGQCTGTVYRMFMSVYSVHCTCTYTHVYMYSS